MRHVNQFFPSSLGFVRAFVCFLFLVGGSHRLCWGATLPAPEAPCPAEAFQTTLSEIGFVDLDSIHRAAEALVREATGKPDECRDGMMRAFRTYCEKARMQYSRKIETLPIDPTEELKINLSLAPIGWKLETSEGMYYVAETGGWFETRFAGILSPAYREFFRIWTREVEQETADDAALLISWEEIRRRLTAWEQFRRAHGEFVETETVEWCIHGYGSAFLFGMDNTPIYDFQTRKVRPEVKKAYEAFLKENQDSRYFTMVKEHYEVLKADRFTITPDRKKSLREAEKNFSRNHPPYPFR